jgi:hypothetical protein
MTTPDTGVLDYCLHVGVIVIQIDQLLFGRRHCANKIQSLYKVLNFQHGRSKYIKRKIEVPTVTDVR